MGPSDRIKQRRLELGLSQEAVARQLGVAKNSVTRWEAGVVPRGKNLDQLAAALKVTVDWIMRGDDEPTPPTPPDPPHWREFLEKYDHLGELTEEQVTEIKRFAARSFTARSWTDFERVAEIVRTSQPSPTFEAKKAARLREKAEKRQS